MAEVTTLVIEPAEDDERRRRVAPPRPVATESPARREELIQAIFSAPLDAGTTENRPRPSAIAA